MRKTTHPRSLLGHLIVLAFVVAGLQVATAGAAAAADCAEWGARTGADGTIYPYCIRYEDGSGGSDPGGGGGSGPPPCNLDEAPYTEFCSGTAACWGNDPAAVQDPQELKGVPKPEEDSHVVYKACKRPDGSTFDEWSWSTEGGPSLADRVLTARGLLRPPVFRATFNPPRRTFVNLPTWWWAEDAPAGRVEGTPAFGLIAIATPNKMIVEPGDGSPSFTCPLTTTKSDECSYTYRRASNRGSARAEDGSAAYLAVVRIVYDVTYEDGGTPLDVTGMDASLTVMESRSEVPVPVREIQSRVTEVG